MIIGVDLDGVTGNYTGAFRRYAAEAYNIPELEVMAAFPEPDDYAFTKWMHVGQDFVGNHAQAVANGLYREMEVMDKASETLWKLDSEGHRIRIITSRFVKHGQNYKVVANTAEWLDKHDIPYRDILFMSDKADVTADVFVDDSPDNIVALRAAGKPVIVYDALYNRHMGDEFRAYNWDDVYSLINEIRLTSNI